MAVDKKVLTEQEKTIILSLCDCNMSPTEVARKMHYNRGTIHYHLKKIKEKTDLDPRMFNDLVELKRLAE